MTLPSTDTPWELLEHTADIRIAVRGQSLAELFANAARAVGYLLGACEVPEKRDTVKIQVQADNEEELLVEWLREILYRAQTHQFVPLRADITELAENELTGVVEGFTRTEDCEPELEIKGVTYHELSVTKTEEGYEARVVFDI